MAVKKTTKPKRERYLYEVNYKFHSWSDPKTATIAAAHAVEAAAFARERLGEHILTVVERGKVWA